MHGALIVILLAAMATGGCTSNIRMTDITLADVIRDFPEIWQPKVDTETGQEIPNVIKCSLEGL